jgi:hypothetical protein
MGLISKLICEHPLPVPFEDFTEEEEEYFKETRWDEMHFYTSSFFDYDEELNCVSSYTITEDGQFYRDKTEVTFVEGEDGSIERKERDGGIEKQNFTGEIYFGTEILEESCDYTVTFKSLFYKGELKELDLEEFEKRNNEERKKSFDKISCKVKEEKDRTNSLRYKIALPFVKVSYFTVSIIKWVLIRVYHLLLKAEGWLLK